MYSNCNLASTTLQTGWDLRGLSGEKPTDPQMPNGSTYLEMDTGNVYIWDKENEQWRAL